MSYTILETHCVFEKDQLTEVAVLWEDNESVRATHCGLKPKAGYENLRPNETVTPQLFQRVAGAGTYLTDEQKERFFPGERKWSR